MVAWTYFLDIMTSIKMWRRRNIRKQGEDYMEDEVFGEADDPAEHDEELRKKLAENDIIAKKRMGVVSVFFQFFLKFCFVV